jgi:hypothetical protein
LEELFRRKAARTGILYAFAGCGVNALHALGFMLETIADLIRSKSQRYGLRPQKHCVDSKIEAALVQIAEMDGGGCSKV